jgi:hypothetical protein
MEGKKLKFGFGLNDTHCFGETFDTVDEVIEFAQEEYDSQNSDYFNKWIDEHCIYVGIAEEVSALDYAPSIDDILDQMTDSFYCDHNIDDDDICHITDKREIVEKEYNDFISKYFELPNNITLTTFWNIGVYDLKKHEWIEKFDDFETLIHYSSKI